MDDQSNPSGSSKPQVPTPHDTSPAPNPDNITAAPVAGPETITPTANSTLPSKSHKKAPIIIGILLLLALISAPVYHLNSRDKTVNTTTAAKDVSASVSSANNN